MDTPPGTFRFSDVMTWVSRATGAIVNIDDCGGYTYRVPELQLTRQDRYHHGPFCSHAKRSGLQPQCQANKHRSLARAQRDGTAFWGTCPFGLWDLAFPVLRDAQPIAVFYLGGFRGAQAPETPEHPYRGPDLPRITTSKRRELLRYGGFLADHFLLIVNEWHRRGGDLGKHKHNDFYFDNAKAFIASHYDQPIAITDLADLLKVSAQHLGKAIKAASGHSFRHLLQHYRLERAEILLATGQFTVTQVAFDVGFSDSNYFSTVFRRHFGHSPRHMTPASDPSKSLKNKGH
ncbi:MAG: helix-turn-helix domain-containing protein [Planctomycetota bacterium]|jgi:AraC-like DNA-binding protein|nr:helix-turn-helix domain-containing protein [Planctomycetota bacterium]